VRSSLGRAGDSLGTGAVMGLLRLDGGRCGANLQGGAVKLC
jgi:hypothetical protein